MEFTEDGQLRGTVGTYLLGTVTGDPQRVITFISLDLVSRPDEDYFILLSPNESTGSFQMKKINGKSTAFALIVIGKAFFRKGLIRRSRPKVKKFKPTGSQADR